RANNHAEQSRAPYAYGTFADGARIVLALRRAYRRHFDMRCREPVPHPFRMDREIFNRPSPELPEVPGLPVSHIMYEVWWIREDLREAFNLRTFEGRESYIHWYLTTAAADMGLDDTYVAPIRSRFKTAGVSGPGWQ